MIIKAHEWSFDSYKAGEYGDHCIIHGDCYDVLPTIPNRLIGLVLTDPPYSLPNMVGSGAFGKRKSLTNTKGFTDGGCDYSFLTGFDNWFCFCSKQQLADLINIASKRKRWNTLVWCKPNPVPTCNNKYLPDVEFIVHSFMPNRLFGSFSQKSCYSVIPSGDKETTHPNEKPLRLIRKLVILGSQSGDLILDPFLGSGTTLVASKALGRRAIGIESVYEHCEIAEQRLAQEVLAL